MKVINNFIREGIQVVVKVISFLIDSRVTLLSMVFS